MEDLKIIYRGKPYFISPHATTLDLNIEKEKIVIDLKDKSIEEIQEEINSYGLGYLPSKFQIGDKVNINFGEKHGVIKDGEVIKIHFTKSKVLYDVSIQVEYLDEKKDKLGFNYGSSEETRLYNIDSIYVEKINNKYEK